MDKPLKCNDSVCRDNNASGIREEMKSLVEELNKIISPKSTKTPISKELNED